MRPQPALIPGICLALASPVLADERGDELIAAYLDQAAGKNARVTIQIKHVKGSQPPIFLAFTWMRRVQAKLTSHFIRMESPPSEQGKLLLVHERPDGSSDYVAYRPQSALSKKVRISGARHYKYKSLRISVQELIGGELAKYTHHYLGNREIGGVSCHLVENRLKPEFTGKSDFPRSILALSADRMTMVQWELYDRSNRLARKMVATETKVVDGTPTVTRARISSPQRDSQLQFNVQSIEFDPSFKPDLFRKEFLKRHSPLPPSRK